MQVDNPITVSPGRADSGPGAELLRAFVAELEILYEPGFADRSPSATQADFSPPHGRFLVLYDGDRPVACGGLKRSTPDVAEIKRMYVAPEARGRGFSRRLLAALEGAARELGYRKVRLDTGAYQPLAQGLYERAGYRPVPRYNDNPYAVFWGEKELDP
jgi:GNAT superfamily N-acetyltransferase